MEYFNFFRNKLKFPPDKLHAWIVVFLVFFFPIVALFNHIFDLRESQLSYFFRSFNILLSLWVIAKSFYHKKILVKFEILLLLIFWALYLFRMFSDIEYYEFYLETPYTKGYYYQYVLFITFIPMFAAGLLKPINFNYLIFILKNILKFFNLYILLNYLIAVFLNKESIFRFTLHISNFDFLDSITIGVYASLLIIILVFSNKMNPLDYIFIIIAFVNLMVAASRGPLIFLALTFVLVLVFNPKLLFSSMTDLLKKFLWFAGVCAISLPFFSFNSALMYRLSNFSADESSIKRFSILNDVLNQFLSNPFTGTHFLVVSSKMYSHNMFLDILLSTGFLGLIFVLPVIFVFLYIVYLNRFKSVFICIAFFFFLNAMTSGSIYNLYEFWILLALVISNQNYLLNSFPEKRNVYHLNKS